MPLLGEPAHDIREMSHSPNHRKRVKKYGKKKAHEMEVAAAMHTRDTKRAKKKTAKKSAKRKATRRKRSTGRRR